MLAIDGVSTRAQWQVLWINKGRIQRKDFEHDLSGALELYGKVLVAERKGATLRCCNMGFPPPDKYADREEIIVIRDGRRFKGRKLIIPRVYRDTMNTLNARGIFWCPYCITMRKFKRKEFFRLEGIKVEEPSMNCPMCDISHRDGNVMKYNPTAVRFQEMRRTRSDKGKARG